ENSSASTTTSKTINLTKAGDRFGEYASRATPLPGHQDVVIHGSEDSFYQSETSPAISHRAVARGVTGDPNYNGDPLRILSCKTAGVLEIRTDGRWVWPGDLAYYVRHYGVAVPGDFIARMESKDFKCSPLTMEQLLQVEAQFLASVGPPSTNPE